MEDISERSGRELLDIVDSAIRLLRVNPEMAPRYSEKYRRLVLRDRSLGIFYSLEFCGIIVHAIRDQWRLRWRQGSDEGRIGWSTLVTKADS